MAEASNEAAQATRIPLLMSFIIALFLSSPLDDGASLFWSRH
jgi:hypothetical protein